ncbi:MAG TPA: serine/threonine-protein kinase [Kofleriaceae bacterium]|nr:serine/threonine-protein kinase [Kofleriaceae bacterium]
MIDRIGQYQVVGLLAIGGEGREVLLAKSPSGGPVAIKKIPRGVGRGSTARHPNLVDVIEIVQIGDDLYRIMEYLEGENLAGLIRRLIKRHERISFGLAAHIAGELHRAVSPDTVFITYGGELKLLDLGVAVTDPESLYRSPEQAGSRPLGRQSDVYSTGLVLYELTTLRRVFATPQQLAAAIPPPSSQTDSYPPQLDSICMQALARDPAERFRSAAEMRDALLVTAGTLDSSGDPSQAIASKLMRLFGDRIAAKRQLLDRVRVGQPLGDLVATEVDEEIDVPSIVRDDSSPAGRATIEDADLRAPELARIARVSRQPQAAREVDDELVTGKPWSSRPPALPLRAAESGVLVKTKPAEAHTLPPDNAVAEAHGFRWGVLVLFVLAVALGGAAGAYLRLYWPF